MRKIIHLESVDSTNSYLRSLANDGAEQGTVVIADTQTAGRGRMGRSFSSPNNTGIYLSYLIRPDFYDFTSFTSMTAVAVSRAIEENCKISPKIKWVNDLFYNNKKICGILAEAAFSSSQIPDFIIIGIGLNVNTPISAFPEELRSTVGSIFSETDSVFDRDKLTEIIINNLDKTVTDFADDRQFYLDYYRKNSMTIGQKINVIKNGDSIPAFAEAVTDSFALRVRYENGETEELSSGEVTIRNRDER